MTEYKFEDLTEGEKEAVRALAQYRNFPGSWAEEGKENWDKGATLFKNGRIGFFAPISFERKK